ncbi:MAG: 5'-3' exonuclease H3TH domain-containing protein [Candidatus Pacebacteria bacterium]|nr:5'-3' exonuclease H3TH domain-containing protein [Candidatus Paceibacterota bacterium]
MNFLIIDSNALLHRSYHALPPLQNQNGELLNAVYGFVSVLIKAINEVNPDFIAAAFDVAGPTFRHINFKEYKAKRKKPPEEFYKQIPKIKEVLLSFGIPIFEKEGFEADDIIATLVKKINNQIKDTIQIYILTGDLDTLQLVSENVKIYTLKKGIKDTIFYTPKEVENRFGLTPGQIVDFKTLRGDPSDNIPGVKGIGEKTAIKLLKKYKTLDDIYKAIENGSFFLDTPTKTKKIQEKLISQRENVYFGKDLVEVRDDVPIEFNLKKCLFKKDLNTYQQIEEILTKLNFYSLIPRIKKIFFENNFSKEKTLF